MSPEDRQARARRVMTPEEGDQTDRLARGEQVPGGPGACTGCHHGEVWHRKAGTRNGCEKCNCRKFSSTRRRPPTGPTTEQEGPEVKTMTTMHVAGSTAEEVEESYEEAVAHHTPAGADHPSRGAMNRLGRERTEALEALPPRRFGELTPDEQRAATAEALRQLEEEIASPEFAAAMDEADRRLAASAACPGGGEAHDEHMRINGECPWCAAATDPAPKPAKSARGARRQADATQAAGSATRMRRAAAEDHVTALLAAAADEEPYVRAMRLRKEAGNRRTGETCPIADADLTEWVRSLLAAHPDYTTGQAWKVARWCDRFQVTRARFGKAWKEATGADPGWLNRRPRS